MLEVSPWVAVDRPQPVGVQEFVYLLTSLKTHQEVVGEVLTLCLKHPPPHLVIWL